jgi:hypothetical protein
MVAMAAMWGGRARRMIRKHRTAPTATATIMVSPMARHGGQLTDVINDAAQASNYGT